MKKVLIIIGLLLWTISSYCQLDHFLVGIWSYDYDNNPWPIPNGTDRASGNDIEFLRQLKNMNINCIHIERQLFQPSIQFASGSPSKLFLDNANSLNLKILLSCPDIHVNKTSSSYNSSNSNSGLNYYGNHPSILGFSVVDEPEPNHFNAISQYFSDIQSYKSTLLRYSNLFPMYADVTHLGSSAGTPSSTAYENYIENFIDDVEPNILSFDSYPIWLGWPRDFFYNLDIISNKSVEHNIPFIYVLTPIKSPTTIYCNTTTVAKNKAEFNYVINSALVYGAKGISYWNAGACFRCWDVSIPSDVMQHLSSLHHRFVSCERTLLSLIFKNAYHISNNSTIKIGSTEAIPSYSEWTNFKHDIYANEIFDVNNPIQAQSGSKIDNIVISFLIDNVGNRYFWIFNKSITDDEYIKMNFKESTALINILDNKIYQESQNRVVYLEPGEAKLFKINRDFLSNVSMCNKNYYSGTYSDILAENIFIGGASCNVNYYNGSRINYYASRISLGNGVKIYEGSKVSFNGATYNYGTLKSTFLDEKLTIVSEPKEIEQGITIFPNPSSGQLTVSTINIDNKIISLEIYNLMGMKVVEMKNLNNNNIDLALNLNSGTYFIRISSNEGFLTKKIVIK